MYEVQYHIQVLLRTVYGLKTVVPMKFTGALHRISPLSATGVTQIVAWADHGIQPKAQRGIEQAKLLVLHFHSNHQADPPEHRHRMPYELHPLVSIGRNSSVTKAHSINETLLRYVTKMPDLPFELSRIAQITASISDPSLAFGWSAGPLAPIRRCTRMMIRSRCCLRTEDRPQD